jgi:UDP-glucose 4-epimerase
VNPWFVVGGAGFIGTNLAKRRDCTVFDPNAYPGDDALNYHLLLSRMDGHETVVHLAANADIAAGAENPDLDLDGISMTRNVVRAARRVGVKRIIYTSGSGVYGHRSHAWPTEDTACYPISSYGAAKLASEAILHAYEQYGIEVTIFRPANVVGPDQTHGVGFDFMRKLRKDPTRLEILGDGLQSKQYLHVDDLLDAFELAGPGTFNVGPTTSLQVIEIAEMAREAAGCSKRTHLDVQGGLAWPGDIPTVRLDCTKLERLGWEARPSRLAMKQALAVL